MASIIALTCIAAALILLFALSVIDLREGLLPDKLVLPFMLTGLVFHYVSTFHYSTPPDLAAGMVLGGGILYAVRLAANAWYKDDALGLGDVKLLAAAGAWLGAHDIMLAVIAGALVGIAHGLGLALLRSLKTKTPMNLKTLSLPAGPGFAAGIVIAGIFKFHSL